MGKQRRPNVRRFQEMEGRTGGMGEHVGDPRRYVSEPGTAEDTDLLKGIFKGGKRPASSSRKPRLDPIESPREYGMKTIRTIEAGARMVEMSPRLVGSTKSVRIDSGLEYRKDILVANMSSQAIWINTRPLGSTSNDGFPLGPISAAGKYDGGSITIDATSDVYLYARAGAGAGNLIIVIETAR